MNYMPYYSYLLVLQNGVFEEFQGESSLICSRFFKIISLHLISSRQSKMREFLADSNRAKATALNHVHSMDFQGHLLPLQPVLDSSKMTLLLSIIRSKRRMIVNMTASQ